jgi:hypothetical protein
MGNKSQKVRDYLAEHPEAGPAAVAKKLGVSVSLVSAIKGSRAGTRRRQTSKVAKRSIPGRRDRSRVQSTVVPVVAAAELIRACGGVDGARAALDTAGKVAAVLQ